MTPDLTILGKVIGGGPAGCGLRGPARADGAGRAGGRRLPGGHAVRATRSPPRPGLATLRLLDDGAYERLERLTRALADGLREAAADAPVQVCHTTGLLTVFFSEEPVRDYEDAKRCDTEAYAAFCRAMLDRGRLPAAVAVRGLVPLARAHGRARGAHARGRPRGVRGVSVLSEIAAAAGPSLAPYAVPEPGAAALRRARSGERPFVLEAVYEGYLLHYGRSRAVRGHGRRTCGCSPGTRSTRSASRGSRRAATCRPWPSCPT